jgi:glycosyltransferase involved in cell wall biosynthesis
VATDARSSVVIATHNRAELLAETLRNFTRQTTRRPWELIVVDNASTDATAAVVHGLARSFPVPLTYVLEPVPGKYRALNRGIQLAAGRMIAATDDDALVEPDWLEQADHALERLQCDFVGGPVRPIWGGPRPEWLPEKSGLHWKVIALQDHGAETREYGRGISWPLGVNVAYRRDAFERAGFFDPDLGRVAGTLRNQAQREWHLRARAAGLRGFYVPQLVVQHHVPASRLTRNYFRRWCYWHGISRVILANRSGCSLEDPDSRVEEHQHPAAITPALIGKALLSVRSFAWRSLRGDAAVAFEHELWLWFCAGVARESIRGRFAAVKHAQALKRAAASSWNK